MSKCFLATFLKNPFKTQKLYRTVVLVLKYRLYDEKDFRAFKYAFKKSENFEKL